VDEQQWAPGLPKLPPKGRCGKTAWPTEEGAAGSAARSTRRGVSLSIYQCDECGGAWHLTSAVKPVSFQRETPFDRARRLIKDDLNKVKLTDQDQRWLEENPTSWLRALTAHLRRVDVDLGRAHAQLRTLAPADGQNPSEEYLKLKAEHDVLAGSRRAFREVVLEKIDRAKSVYGDHPVDEASVLVRLMNIREVAQTEPRSRLLAAIDSLIDDLDPERG